MTTAGQAARGADVRVIPPLVYALPFAAGAAVQLWVPLELPGGAAMTVAGGALLTAGAALTAAGVRTVIRHRTALMPHHAVSTLVTDGPFRLSRNPMYTGFAVAYLGGALLLGSWWPLVALPFVLFAIRRMVIDREERYLTERFGGTYREYCTRVRRWL